MLCNFCLKVQVIIIIKIAKIIIVVVQILVNILRITINSRSQEKAKAILLRSIWK